MDEKPKLHLLEVLQARLLGCHRERSQGGQRCREEARYDLVFHDTDGESLCCRADGLTLRESGRITFRPGPIIGGILAPGRGPGQGGSSAPPVPWHFTTPTQFSLPACSTKRKPSVSPRKVFSRSFPRAVT